MDTMFRRCDASKRLRRLLSASVDVNYCRKIYITIPAASEHKTHPVSKRKVSFIIQHSKRDTHYVIASFNHLTFFYFEPDFKQLSNI